MWLRKIASFVKDVHLEKVRLAAFQVLGSAAQISVSEINCPEPNCPPIKTVILIFGEGQATRSLTIHKPAAKVAAADIEWAKHAAA